MNNSLAPVILGLVGVVFVVGGVSSYIASTHIESKTIYVESKERITTFKKTDNGVSSEIKNFVYTTDEAYVVDDSFWNWHFDSTTVYAKLIENKNCNVVLSGYRIGWLNMFQNIISAECE